MSIESIVPVLYFLKSYPFSTDFKRLWYTHWFMLGSKFIRKFLWTIMLQSFHTTLLFWFLKRRSICNLFQPKHSLPNNFLSHCIYQNIFVKITVIEGIYTFSLFLITTRAFILFSLSYHSFYSNIFSHFLVIFTYLVTILNW